MIKIDKPLLLASSSESRRMLLKRLQIPFESCSPDIDESPLLGESVPELAQRLALEKAQAVAARYSGYYIVASDQVPVCEGSILNKPLGAAKAIEQLQFQSGKTTVFHTSLCLFDTDLSSYQLGIKSYQAKFRTLSLNEIRDYVSIDKPYNCAGSFKAESLGISLFEKLEGDDPNTLIGLPLILLTSFLRNISH